MGLSAPSLATALACPSPASSFRAAGDNGVSGTCVTLTLGRLMMGRGLGFNPEALEGLLVAGEGDALWCTPTPSTRPIPTCASTAEMGEPTAPTASNERVTEALRMRDCC